MVTVGVPTQPPLFSGSTRFLFCFATLKRSGVAFFPLQFPTAMSLPPQMATLSKLLSVDNNPYRVDGGSILGRN